MRETRWRNALRPYHEAYGLDVDSIPAGAGRLPFSDASAGLLEAFRPRVVSFHFGLPEKSLLDRVKATGAKILSSATTVDEARWLEAHGAHAVIAQGLEAGGHRGMFLDADLNTQMGTLALGAHTAGVLGRLFADALENATPLPEQSLRTNGVAPMAAFFYATLPQTLPQMLSYALYRWENNIRAAAILGVVGAGGLGQMLKYHLSLFQMQKAATVILAMLLLVADERRKVRHILGIDQADPWRSALSRTLRIPPGA